MKREAERGFVAYPLQRQQKEASLISFESGTVIAESEGACEQGLPVAYP
jgi:hypothetical protein